MHGQIQHHKVESPGDYTPGNKSTEKHELDLSWLLPIQGDADAAVSNVVVPLQTLLH